MSCFVGATAASFGGMLIDSDDRAVQRDYQWGDKPPRMAQSPWEDGGLWINARSLGGGFSGSLSGDAQSDGGRWEPYGTAGYFGWDESGGARQNVIVGQTLDSTGAALGNCIVQCFVTATDVFVGQVTSDTAGYYRIPTTYGIGVAHYLVCYKAGSPDVAGTSVNTLNPTATG